APRRAADGADDGRAHARAWLHGAGARAPHPRAAVAGRRVSGDAARAGAPRARDRRTVDPPPAARLSAGAGLAWARRSAYMSPSVTLTEGGTSMEQLTFVESERLEWRDVPAPRLESDAAALVRPLAVTTCDLDHAIVRGRVPLPGPFPLGHEFVAEVTDVGDAVESVRPGDRVVVPFQISCGRCGRCRKGLTSSCESAPVRAAYGLGPIGGLEWGGALAEVVRVPFADALLQPLPPAGAPSALARAPDHP